MKKIISYILICIFGISIIFYDSTFIVFASSYYEKVPYNDLDVVSKVAYALEFSKQLTGVLLTLDFASAGDICYEYIKWANGDYPIKKPSEMTKDEQEEFYTGVLDSLNSKGLKFNSVTNAFNSTASFKKEMKEFMKEFIEKYEQPMYAVVQVPCLESGTLKASMLSYTRNYEVVKKFLQEYDFVLYLNDSTSNQLAILPLKSDDFFLLKSRDNDYTHLLFDTVSETRSNRKAYVHNFDDDYSIPAADLSSDDWYYYDSNSSYVSICSIGVLDVFGGHYPSGFYTSSNYALISRDTDYIRVYNNLSDYQNMINGTQERNVYYTSNYYTTNYTDSSMSYDDLCIYMDNIDKILQVIAKESSENNYDENTLTRRLDALINALWATNGDISDDLDDILSGTTTWLEKIYNVLEDFKTSLIKKLDNISITSDSNVSVDIGDDIFDDWNKDLNNVVNDIVNDTDVNLSLFLDGLTSDFNEVGKVVKTKFPFCIPWDIEVLIAFLADTPETPVFTIPLKLESYNIDYTIEVDLSRFETVSKISRTMLTMLYVVMLVNLSVKIVEMKEGSNNG